jgi:hypothetical protein
MSFESVGCPQIAHLSLSNHLFNTQEPNIHV